ncbi:type II toxin-antitoxin system YoeB family toxin [Patescibacteria group bacterium]|nr:type II toxin-antitoxin system YoeB family toxin [Patescibacteria group bacterium]MBU4512537.1 type II toxin-antitoxin system YoeB family toxin [Patescibacteria group bacterium]MCG2692678.1 type II toxin-antitoxin system YoeB family toxin [Candidatus Parcubacteria bacterium]
MVKLVYGKKFLKSAKKLPKEQREKLAELLEVFENNPFNPILHSKALARELIGFYSFRITRDWRVIFRFITAFEIQLIIAGHRKDIYRKL